MTLLEVEEISPLAELVTLRDAYLSDTRVADVSSLSRLLTGEFRVGSYSSTSLAELANFRIYEYLYVCLMGFVFCPASGTRGYHSVRRSGQRLLSLVYHAIINNGLYQ